MLSSLPISLVVLADAIAGCFEAVWRGVPVERFYCNLPHFKTRIRTTIDQKFSFLAQILHPKSISQKNHAKRLFAVYYILKKHPVYVHQIQGMKGIKETTRKTSKNQGRWPFETFWDRASRRIWEGIRKKRAFWDLGWPRLEAWRDHRHRAMREISFTAFEFEACSIRTRGGQRDRCYWMALYWHQSV